MSSVKYNAIIDVYLHVGNTSMPLMCRGRFSPIYAKHSDRMDVATEKRNGMYAYQSNWMGIDVANGIG